MGKSHFYRQHGNPDEIVAWFGFAPVSRYTLAMAESMLKATAVLFSEAEAGTTVSEIAFGTNGSTFGVNGKPAKTENLKGNSFFRYRIRISLTSAEFVHILEDREIFEALRDLAISCFCLGQFTPREHFGLADLVGIRQQRAQNLTDALIAWHNTKH